MKRISFQESDIHFPEPVRQVVQPLIRGLLLTLAGYKVTVEGELPSEPSFLAAYPHGEHANSLLLPPNDIVYMAAADHWYTNILLQVATAAVVDTVPVVRENAALDQRNRELDLQAETFHKRKKHVLIYPQGTRRGPAQSAEELEKQLKRGIAFMAHYHQKLTYPVGLAYPADYQPKKDGPDGWDNLKQRLTGAGRDVPITVRIGEPLEPPDPYTHATRDLFLSTLARQLFKLAR